MGYNNSDNRQSGRRTFGRRDFNSPGGDRQMHKAICSSCGRECEVPFKPLGDKPVFCSNCFEKNKSGSDTRRFEDRNIKPPQNNDQYNTINAKLDKILAMLTSGPLIKDPVIIAEKKNKAPKKTVLPPEA